MEPALDLIAENPGKDDRDRFLTPGCDHKVIYTVDACLIANPVQTLLLNRMVRRNRELEEICGAGCCIVNKRVKCRMAW